MKKLLSVNCNSNISISHTNETSGYFKQKWLVSFGEGIVFQGVMPKIYLTIYFLSPMAVLHTTCCSPRDSKLL